MAKSEKKLGRKNPRLRFQTPLRDGDVVVDNSIMKEVFACSTAAVLRYGLHLAPKTEGVAMVQGAAGHAALATWLETDSVNLALKAYRQEYDAHVRPAWAKLPATDGKGREHPDRTRLAFKRTRRILEEWFQGHPKFPLHVEPEDTELPMSWPLMELKDGRRVVFVALLDAIAKRRTGGLWSVDHKFRIGVTDWWKQKQKTAAQFTGQTWLARQWEIDVAGVYVNAIEIPNAKTSTKKCPEHHVAYVECDTRHVRHELFPVARSKTEIANWKRTLTGKVPRWVALRDGVRELADVAGMRVPMEGRFNEACTFCGFQEWCRVGRPATAGVDFFTPHTWNPLAERRGSGQE